MKKRKSIFPDIQSKKSKNPSPLDVDHKIKKNLVDWNQIQTHYPRDSSVAKEFEKTVKKYPNRIAVKYLKRKMTYQELNEKANHLARYLQKTGVKKQEFVGISMQKSIDFIVGILAITKLGAIYVPIDISFPLERRAFFIENAKIKILITQKNFVSLFPQKELRLVILDEIRNQLNRLGSKNLNVAMDPLDLFYLMYTSGTTGRPKGVKIMHRGVLRLVMGTNWINITPEDCFLHISNISFDAATFEIWGALLNGGCLCIYPHTKLIPKDVANFLEKEKITQIIFSARFFNLMVDHHISSLKGIHYLQSGGETMSVYHAKKAYKSLKKTKILNAYGPTENTGWTTTFTIKSLKAIQTSVPIGKPISNSTVYILDKKLCPVPIGIIGEIYSGGDGVSQGYLNLKEQTRKRFIRDPFRLDPEAKMYRTGDLGEFLPDGNILFHGRRDTQEKIRGFRIEVPEIEETVKKIQKVKDCITIVSEEIKGEKQLAAYVLVTHGLTSEKIREILTLKLPSQMIPDFIIILDKFPMTATGKIDRRALAFPRSFLAKEKGQKISLDSTITQIVRDAWIKLLQLKKIDRTDNFFHVGGNSIKAVELSTLLSQALKKEISSNLIFEEPIFQNFAKKIEEFFNETEPKKRKELFHSDLFWIWRNKEVRLDPKIGKEKLPFLSQNQYTHPKNIFLTGSTGFVAAFFLETLFKKTKAKVYCLVRSKNQDEGLHRIQQVLKQYHIWKKEYALRIIIVCGDLREKFLGIGSKQFYSLAKLMDSVFHIGATVNHVLLYEDLKKANVQGTEEIIRFCQAKKRKPLHFISTIDVFNHPKVIHEEENLQESKHLFTGYAQSKWVAEKKVMLARKNGLEASIYRLSRTIGSSKNGASPTGDFLWRMIQVSIQMKMFPDVNFSENMTPVDFVADALFYISKKASNIGKEYHLFSPYLRSYRDIFTMLKNMGYQMKLVNYERWKKRLYKESLKKKEEKLRAIVPLFSELNLSELPSNIRFGFKNLDHALEGTLECPQIDKRLMEKYLHYYASIGFLPALKKK